MFEQYPKEFWRDVKPIVPKLRQGALLKEDMSNAQSLIDAVPRYSAVHSFLELLQSKGKLLKNFTQNIDALELAAGVEPANLITCHGTWETATCLSCDGKVAASNYLPVVLAGKLPLCSCGKPAPVDPNSRQSARLRRPTKVDEVDIEYIETQGGESAAQMSMRTGRKKRNRKESEIAALLRRDSDDDDKFDAPSRPGLLKPDITFFGESIARDYYPVLEEVEEEADLLIIVGTSLAAQPVSELPLQLPKDVPQIWISNERCRNKVRGLNVDIELIGDADTVIQQLCLRAGWGNTLRNRLWRNNLGSRKQAQDAMSAIKSQRTAIAEESKGVSLNEEDKSVVTGPDEQKDGLRIADIPPVVKVEVATPQQDTKEVQNNPSDRSDPHASEASQPLETKLDIPSASTADKPLLPPTPPPVEPLPSAPQSTTVQPDPEPPLSPPIPFRGNPKRPLSMTEPPNSNGNSNVPLASIDSAIGLGLSSISAEGHHSSKKLRAESSSGVKAVDTTNTTAVADTQLNAVKIDDARRSSISSVKTNVSAVSARLDTDQAPSMPPAKALTKPEVKASSASPEKIKTATTIIPEVTIFQDDLDEWVTYIRSKKA
jgi:NAD-dependent SIR2 family protein deacetylase